MNRLPSSWDKELPPSPPRYQWRLLDICDLIHGSYKTTGDSLSSNVLRVLIAWLEKRLADWDVYEKTIDCFRAYDDAVKALVVAAIGEAKAQLERVGAL